MRIQPIVEGHGEVRAVPVLLRRLCEKAGLFSVSINRPHRSKRSQLVQEESLRKAVRVAALEPCQALLVVFDADDDCPKELAPRVQEWAAKEVGQLPCAVVVAKREYEAWFLAAAESLRGHRGVRPDASNHHEPEAPRDARGAFEKLLQPGSHYLETTDQAAFSALFDLSIAFRNSRSFRRLVHALEFILRRVGEPESMPPEPSLGFD